MTTIRHARREAPEQLTRATDTAADLSEALDDLAALCKRHRKVAPERHPDLHELHVAWRAVVAAEEAHDIAVLDLRGASGEDI